MAIPVPDRLKPRGPVRSAPPRGCTHLNDMLRALAAVPALARNLPAAAPRPASCR